MKNLTLKKLIAWTLAGALALAPVMSVAAAEENAAAEGEAAGEEDSEAAEAESEAEGDDTALTMSGLTSSNGRYIAATYLESLLPEGFHKSSCTYEGQHIEIANMDNDFNGEVVLAYLADEDGSNGDFYLCDINTAEMSDFVQIKNGDEGYIVVLDPGDVVVAPGGYTRARLEWYGGKTVTAWLLPGTGSNSQGEQDADKEARSFFVTNVYAASAGEAAAGSGRLDESAAGAEDEAAALSADSDESGETNAADDGANIKALAGAPGGEDGSRVVYADPSDFFMVYAIDNTGTVGFYIYDKVQKTYQRYVVNSTADSELLDQYKDSARIRLYIIAALAFLLVVLLFVLVNLLISRRDDIDDFDPYEDEEEEEPIDDVERVRRRVVNRTNARAQRSRSDDGYVEEEPEVPVRRRAYRSVADEEAPAAAPGRRQMPARAEEDVQISPAPRRRQTPARAEEDAQISPAPRRRQAPVRAEEDAQAEAAPRRRQAPQVRVEEEAPAAVPRRRASRAAGEDAGAAGDAARPQRRPARRSPDRSEMKHLMDIEDTDETVKGSATEGRKRSDAPVRRRPRRPRPELDEDFEFEFIDIE